MALRDRIVEVASDLFYREGLRAVGVDRVIAEADIAKATLYRHFASKEDLIVAYLQRRHANVLKAIGDGLPTSATPWPSRVLAVFHLLHRKAESADFRGCAFMLAVAESESSPRVLEVAQQHKDAVKNVFLALLPADRPGRSETAVRLNLLYDGALAQIMIHRHPRFALVAAECAAMLLGVSD